VCVAICDRRHSRSRCSCTLRDIGMGEPSRLNDLLSSERNSILAVSALDNPRTCPRSSAVRTFTFFLGHVNTNGLFMRYCVHGNHRRPVSPNRAVFADATRQRGTRQSARAQRHLLRRRAGVQMARFAQAVWQLAHHRYTHEPVVEERGAGSRLCPVATRSDHPREDRSRGLGQHPRQGPSRWDGGVKKNGPQAIGRSRGGWTTKIHRVAADARTALTFAVSPGQAHDAPKGERCCTASGKGRARSPC
jgi:hypothetical protein